MSAEPVKVVIVVEGGNITSVLSCGVPIRAVIVDYDTEPDDSKAVDVPQDAVGWNPEKAFVWENLVEDHDPAYALKLFELGAGA